jgi:hypothetical protein
MKGFPSVRRRRRRAGLVRSRSAAAFAGGLVSGSLTTYFFDPRNGKRRRHELTDRSSGAVRRLARRSSRGATGALVRVGGLGARALHLRERRKELTDESLTQKIMSEVFRDPALPKGAVNVNVEHGRAVLRGEVATTDLIGELESRVRDVVGVRDVENLLHVTGTPARMHQAVPSDTDEL